MTCYYNRLESDTSPSWYHPWVSENVYSSSSIKTSCLRFQEITQNLKSHSSLSRSATHSCSHLCWCVWRPEDNCDFHSPGTPWINFFLEEPLAWLPSSFHAPAFHLTLTPRVEITTTLLPQALCDVGSGVWNLHPQVCKTNTFHTHHSTLDGYFWLTTGQHPKLTKTPMAGHICGDFCFLFSLFWCFLIFLHWITWTGKNY